MISTTTLGRGGTFAGVNYERAGARFRAALERVPFNSPRLFHGPTPLAQPGSPPPFKTPRSLHPYEPNVPPPPLRRTGRVPWRRSAPKTQRPVHRRGRPSGLGRLFRPQSADEDP